MWFLRLTLFYMQIIIFLANTSNVYGLAIRSDDEAPLADVVERLSRTVEAHQARLELLEAENRRHVVFTAYIPEGESVHVSSAAIVPFHHVLVNIGNAFNGATGVFTCPYDGDYFFSLSINVSMDYEWMTIRKNNVDTVMADRDDTTGTQLITSVVLNLKVGDTVTVNQRNPATGSGIDSGSDCVFTGFRIH